SITGLLQPARQAVAVAGLRLRRDLLRGRFFGRRFSGRHVRYKLNKRGDDIGSDSRAVSMELQRGKLKYPCRRPCRERTFASSYTCDMPGEFNSTRTGHPVLT